MTTMKIPNVPIVTTAEMLSRANQLCMVQCPLENCFHHGNLYRCKACGYLDLACAVLDFENGIWHCPMCSDDRFVLVRNDDE